MPESTNIFEDYNVFCNKADDFIEKAKEYYFKKELENGRDIKELCKKAAYQPVASTLRKQNNI